MKHSTYKKLYQAHLGAIDEKGLLECRGMESHPFVQSLIDMILDKTAPVIPWDIKPYTTDFQSGNPRQRLDETFFAFVLRIAIIIKQESYIRIYQKPESHEALLAWIYIFRSLLLNSLALLYNVQWTTEKILLHLEPTINKLFSEGDVFSLRKLMVDLGIKIAQEELYPAEKSFEKLMFLTVPQWSSFYWRFLHWMAEAFALRGEEMKFYKNQWIILFKGPLYRTILCRVCMEHFEQMLKQHEKELMDENVNLPQLLFKMHNQTHAYRRENLTHLKEPDYTEAEYEKDAVFMRQALSE